MDSFVGQRREPVFARDRGAAPLIANVRPHAHQSSNRPTPPRNLATGELDEFEARDEDRIPVALGVRNPSLPESLELGL